MVAAQNGVRKSACNGVPPGLEDAFGGSAVWALQRWMVPTVLGVGSSELFPAAGAHFSLGLVKALGALVLEQLKPVWFYNEERSVENKSKAMRDSVSPRVAYLVSKVSIQSKYLSCLLVCLLFKTRLFLHCDFIYLFIYFKFTILKICSITFFFLIQSQT